MNAVATGRFFWREYRTGRGFWIAMLVLTVGIQLFSLAADAFWGSHASRGILWGLANVMPLIYVLGWASTAFSREHETGNFAFLSAIPTTCTPVWLGKVGFTLISSLLLWLALSAITTAFQAPPQLDFRWLAIWALWLVTIAGIGTCCSQWIKRPLTSTFLAGGFVAAIALWPGNGSMSIDDQANWLNQGLLSLLGAIALVVSYPLTGSWLRDRLRWSLWQSKQGPASFAVGAGRGGTWRSQLSRFGWVAWRRLGVVSVAMLILVSLSVPMIRVSEPEIWVPIAVLVLTAWPVLLGVTLFYCEQDPVHARFLISQGISPKRIWWSRQFIGAAVLGGLSLAIMFELDVFVLGKAPNSSASQSMIETTHAYWPYVVLAFAGGQLISMLIRSTLVGLALASLLAFVLIGWTALCTRLGIPAWISVAIPTCGMLVTSRLRVKACLLEWTAFRHWWAPTAALFGTLVLLVTAFASYRATEIPYAPRPIDGAAFAADSDNRYDAVAAEQIWSAANGLSSRRWQTASRYEGRTLQAVREDHGTAVAWAALPLPITTAESAALEDASDLLTPSLDAAVDQAHGLYPSTRWTVTGMANSDPTYVERLGRLYVARARGKQERGESVAAVEDFRRALQICLQLRRGGPPTAWAKAAWVEEIALDNLIFWAADSRHDAGHVASLTRSLVDYWSEEPPWITPLAVEYIAYSRLVEGLPDSFDGLPMNPNQAFFLRATNSFPGEKPRLRRLLNAQHARIGEIPQTIRQRMDGWNSNPFAPLKWQNTTISGSFLQPSGDWLAANLAELQEWRAATLVRLLMIQRRARSGGYPEVSPSGNLPADILRQAEALVRQDPDTSKVSEAIRYLDFGRMTYDRLYETNPDSYSDFHEPLGSYPVDASGERALRTEKRTFALPAQ